MELGISPKDLPKIWLILLLSCCSQGFFLHRLTCPPICRCHPEGQIICQNSLIEGPLNLYMFRVVRNASVQLEIHMEHNKITHIPRRVFENFSSLRNLNLNDNCIKSLDPEAFFGLKQLRFLDMRNNSLTELPIDLFAHQAQLVSLDLRQNSIVRILVETLSPLVSLEQLALGDNPVICDCQMKATLVWVTTRNVSEGDPPITCIRPEVFAKIPWNYLFHLCPGVYRNKASTTTTAISTTIPSSEMQPESTVTFPEETTVPTEGYLCDSTQTPVIHNVSTTPTLETMRNVTNITASANTNQTQEIATFVVVTTVLIILSVFVFVICRRKQKRTRFKVTRDGSAPSVPPPGRGQELLCDDDVDDEEEGYEYVDLGKDSDTARYVSLNQENGVSKK